MAQIAPPFEDMHRPIRFASWATAWMFFVCVVGPAVGGLTVNVMRGVPMEPPFSEYVGLWLIFSVFLIPTAFLSTWGWSRIYHLTVSRKTSKAMLAAFYKVALDEIATQNIDESVWDQALVQAKGDINKAKMSYVQHRAAALISEPLPKPQTSIASPRPTIGSPTQIIIGLAGAIITITLASIVFFQEKVPSNSNSTVVQKFRERFPDSRESDEEITIRLYDETRDNPIFDSDPDFLRQALYIKGLGTTSIYKRIRETLEGPRFGIAFCVIGLVTITIMSIMACNDGGHVEGLTPRTEVPK